MGVILEVGQEKKINKHHGTSMKREGSFFNMLIRVSLKKYGVVVVVSTYFHQKNQGKPKLDHARKSKGLSLFQICISISTNYVVVVYVVYNTQVKSLGSNALPAS